MFKFKRFIIFLLSTSLVFSSTSLVFAEDVISGEAISQPALSDEELGLESDVNDVLDLIPTVEDENKEIVPTTSEGPETNPPKTIHEITKPRIKKNFVDMNEFPKGNVKEHAFYALLQWGYVDKLGGNKTEINWDIDVSIDNGNLQLMGNPLLFEDKDEVSQSADDSSVTGITKTSRHWDGILIKVVPHDKEDSNKIRLNIGELELEFPIKEFFELHGIYELKNGRQVAVRSFHKNGHLSVARRTDAFNRKFAIIRELVKAHERTKELIESGKLTSQQVESVFHILKRLENHEYAQSKGGKWLQRVENFVNKIENANARTLGNEINALHSEFENSCNESSIDDFQDGLVPFEDTPQCAWYTDFARRLKNSQVIRGMAGTNNFAPANNISRAELLAIALAGAGVDVDDAKDSEISDRDESFADANGHWAERGIRYALRQGLIKGFDDGTFKPNNQVTRAEAMAMVYRVFGLDAGSYCSGDHFSDLGDHWACAIIEDAKIVGIVNGFEDGTFKPNEPITRAAMAKIISTTVDYIQLTDDYDEL